MRDDPVMKERSEVAVITGLSEDLFLSAERATSRRLYAGARGCTDSVAVKGEKYPVSLEICSSCRAEMVAYDGATKWDIVASLAVPSPGGLSPLRGWGAHLAGGGTQSLRRGLLAMHPRSMI